MGFVAGEWQDLPRRWALAGLFGANLAPLAGVLLLGWNGGELLVFYWLENGIVGAANVPKMLLANGEQRDATAVGMAGRLLGVAFFLFHYGMFWFVHGAFVFVLATAVGGSGPEVSGMHGSGMLLAVGAVVVSQAVEFWTDYVRDQQYQHRMPREQMTEPYGRVMVLHVVIIVGAFPVLALGSPLPALTLLVVLKFGLDLKGYLQQANSGDRGSRTSEAASTRTDALESEP